MSTTLLYVRVSTDEQAKEGYSIDAQEKVLRAYCTFKGYTDPLVFTDAGFSAKNLNRPALKSLLEHVSLGGVHQVLVWRLDRLSRSLKDTLHIVEDILLPQGVQLVSTSENIDTGTPSGRLMLNVLASFAQAKRENTQERIRMVSGELAKTGKHMGGVPPFGYKVVDGKYLIDPPAAEAVRTLFDMFLSGSGYAAMAKYLKQAGHKTARGNDFSKSSLHDIIKNEKYTGTYLWNRAASATKKGTRNTHKNKPDADIIRIPGALPTIIPRDTWLKAQDTMRKNKVRTGSYSAKQVYTLSGIIFCGVCGRPLRITYGSRDKDGTPQRYYTCNNKCCIPARREEIEFYAMLIIQAYLTQKPIIRQAIEVANSLAATSA